MAMHPSQFLQTVGTQLFLPPFRKKASEKHWAWDQVYTTKKSKKLQEQTYHFSGLGPAVKTPIFGDTAYADMQELSKTTWTHERYTLGAILPQELIDFSQYIDFTRELGESIGDGHAYARDFAAAYPLINAFTSYVVWDGQPLCGSHVTAAGNNINNDLGALSLTYTNVFAAKIFLMTSVYTEDGLPMDVEPEGIIFHPNDLQEVELIVSNQYEPNTTNRNINLLKGMKAVSCKFLPVGHWFVYGTRWKEDNFHWSAIEPTVKQGEDFDRWGVKFTSRSMFSFGPRDYREIVGAHA